MRMQLIYRSGWGSGDVPKLSSLVSGALVYACDNTSNTTQNMHAQQN